MMEEKVGQYISMIFASAFYLRDSGLSQMQVEKVQKVISHTQSLWESYVDGVELLPPLEFASYLNHDAKTPLSVIIGYSELLQTEQFGSINETQRNSLTQILDCAYGMTDLINEWVIQIRTSHGVAPVA